MINTYQLIYTNLELLINGYCLVIIDE